MLDTNLSVDTYGKLKNVSDSHKAPVFPCYDYVAKAKEELMPKSVVDEISTLTDTCMTMPMLVVAESKLDGILQLPSVQERLSSISTLTHQSTPLCLSHLPSKLGWMALQLTVTNNNVTNQARR